MLPKTYRNIIEDLARRRSSTLTVFSDFCRMSACALAAGTRDKEYLAVATNYDRDELKRMAEALALLIREMEEAPFTDVLGEFYLSVASHSSKQARGEFFTPQPVSRLMAQMTVDVEAVRAKGRPITVNEPACGSGGMILALAQLFAPDSVDLLRVTAQDINPVAVDMCYINTALWGIPCRIILGDTIRRNITQQWSNIHWFRVNEPERQKMAEMLSLLVPTNSPQHSNCSVDSDPAESEINLGKVRSVAEAGSGQFLFDF